MKRAIFAALALLAAAPSAGAHDPWRHGPRHHGHWRPYPPPRYYAPPPVHGWRPYGYGPPPVVFGAPYRVAPIPYGCGHPYCHSYGPPVGGGFHFGFGGVW